LRRRQPRSRSNDRWPPGALEAVDAAARTCLERADRTAAWQCRSPYEWQQHVPIALRVGLTPDEVAGVADRSPAGTFSERQRALLAVSDELLARRALSDATWGAVRASLRDREAIELCMLIGHYQGLASTIGALGIQLEQGPGGPS
jgi:alkylhydroperoxidase family enzyme